ncbi:MAG: peptide chain release factor N(5)-glutamine methyltransferase, partial [Deltaproteobacteria bacterium]
MLKWTEAYFKKQGLLKPRLDAEILLSHAVHKRRIDLYLQFDHPLNETELSAFKELVRRRVQHEPIQYMTGHQEFWSLDFSVGPGVLIPRPETECLVEQSLKILANDTKEKIRILDIGCGSGVVAIVLAKERPGAEVVAVDISQVALSCALENAKRHGVGERIEFRRSDIYSGLKEEKFDLIVSNPPYIRTDEWETLDLEIRNYEPKEALVGGEEGIDFHMRIIKGAPLFFQKRGALLL